MMEKNMESNVWHGYLGTNLVFVQTVRGFYKSCTRRKARNIPPYEIPRACRLVKVLPEPKSRQNDGPTPLKMVKKVAILHVFLGGLSRS